MSENVMELFNDDPLTAIRAAETVLDSKMREATQREEQVRAELVSARAAYSALLIELAMDRSTNLGAKFEMRTHIRALEAELEDFQTLAPGFEKEKATITVMENKARQIIRDRRTYL